MARYSTYWRWLPVRMIQEYKRLKQDDSRQAKLFVESINKALEDTQKLVDGDLRIRAVQLVYIKKTHTIDGAAEKLYVSQTTLKRYLYDFVNRVAYYAGFIGESRYKAYKGICYDQEEQGIETVGK